MLKRTIIFIIYVFSHSCFAEQTANVEIDNTDILPPEQAFKLKVTQAEQDVLRFSWEIDSCCYMYKHMFRFTSDSQNIKDVVYPPAIDKNDPDFGDTQVYQDKVSVLVHYDNSINPQTDINVRAQGCNEDLGICYPPTKTTINLPLTTVSSISNNSQLNVSPAETPTNTSSKRGVFGLIAGAFIAGLLLTFTPCVLPMIPILSSIIVGQGKSLSRTKGGALATAFVLGTSVTYAAIGAVAGSTGQQLQAYFQHPFAIASMIIILVLLALSMFGIYNLQIPTFIQSRLQQESMKLQGGRFTMVFILGMLSSLIVGACVSPVLISFLGVAMTSGSGTLGALIMFTMAIGMGVPLILFGIGAGSIIPKAGTWMETVKHFFGVILVAVALYLAQSIPILPVLILWGIALIILAIFLGATQPVSENTLAIIKLKKAVGTISLVWGVLSLIGGMYGERNILHPLPENLISVNSGEKLEKLKFKTLTDIDMLNFEINKAKQSNKLVLIDFYADWCTDCVKMDQTTFRDPVVTSNLNNDFILLKVDLTDPNAQGPEQIKKRFNVYGPPAIQFIHPTLNLLSEQSFYGYKNAEEFNQTVNSIREI